MEDLNIVIKWLKETHPSNKTVEKALSELARLQAIEAAAKLVKGVYEPFSSEDHYSAVAKLIAALDVKP